MTRDEFIKKFPVGSKVRLEDWEEIRFRKVLFYGDNYFFYKSNYGEEYACGYNNDWLPYEDPKEELKLYDVVVDVHGREGIFVELLPELNYIRYFIPENVAILSCDKSELKKVEGKVAMAPASWENDYLKSQRNISEPKTKEQAELDRSPSEKDFRWPHSIASLTIENLTK